MARFEEAEVDEEEELPRIGSRVKFVRSIYERCQFHSLAGWESEMAASAVVREGHATDLKEVKVSKEVAIGGGHAHEDDDETDQTC